MSRSKPALPLLALLLLGALPPALAGAAAMPEIVPPPRMPTLRIEGRARLHEPWLEVRCGEVGEQHQSRCEMTLRATLEALPGSEEGSEEVSSGEPDEGAPPPVVMFTIEAEGGDILEVEGEPQRGVARVPVGEQRRIAMRFVRVLAGGESGPDLEISANYARHPFLGDRAWFHTHGDNLEGYFLRTPGVEVEDELHISVSAPQEIHVRYERAEIEGEGVAVPFGDGHLALTLDAPPAPEPGLLRHGGPYLAFGADIAPEVDAVFIGRLGYEIGLSDYFLLGLAVETDFESYGVEALTIEAATPSLFIIIPSVSGGLGLAVRERAAGVDAALRVTIGLNFPILGVVWTIDYWPTEAQVHGTAAVRLSF